MSSQEIKLLLNKDYVYPDIDDKNFQSKIYKKREFYYHKIPEAEQDIYCAKQPLDAMKPMIQMQILQQVMQMRLQEANNNDDDCNNKGGG